MVNTEPIDPTLFTPVDEEDDSSDSGDLILQRRNSTALKRPLSSYFKKGHIARSTLLNSARTATLIVIVALFIMYA